MKIQFRNPKLKYPLAIRDEKTLIELDWLLEFRFSTSEILAARIGQTAININRFLNILTRSKLVQSFSNNFASKRRLYMLSANGIDFLEAHGRNIEHAVSKASSVGKYSSIVHELCIQHAVIKRLPSHHEVTLGKQLLPDQYLCKPDVLLHNSKGKIAIDYILQKKNKERIFDRFYQHAQAIKNRQYTAVEYLFNNPKDQSYYQKLFNQAQWPRFKHIPNHSKLSPYAKPFFPKQIPGLIEVFSFKHENLLPQ